MKKTIILLIIICSCILLISAKPAEEISQEVKAITTNITTSSATEKPLESTITQREYIYDTYTVTAYCSCSKCCGEWAKTNKINGFVQGAYGYELTSNYSVASSLPCNTEIEIDGKLFVVQDKPAEWVVNKYDNKIIDIYFDTHEQALTFGKQVKKVKIYLK